MKETLVKGNWEIKILQDVFALWSLCRGRQFWNIRSADATYHSPFFVIFTDFHKDEKILIYMLTFKGKLHKKGSKYLE